jgi:hypothetical protein
VLAEAGIKLQEEEEVAQSAAQEAFAKGEMVNLDAAVQTSEQNQEDRIWQKDMRELLLSTASRTTPAGETAQVSTAKAGSLLGTFRLVSVAQSSSIDAAGTSAMQQLAGWKPLPEWPSSAPHHGLREPSTDESDNQQQSGRGYPTAFGSSSTTNSKGKSTAASRRLAAGAQSSSSSSSSRARREQVVLVPTESEPSAYVRQEPRQRDLNDFLASGSEEESESDEEDSDDSSEEVAAEVAQEHDEETTDSELEESGEELSSADEDEGDATAAGAARQPLLQNGSQG